jgi:hypothetical protein
MTVHQPPVRARPRHQGVSNRRVRQSAPTNHTSTPRQLACIATFSLATSRCACPPASRCFCQPPTRLDIQGRISASSGPAGPARPPPQISTEPELPEQQRIISLPDSLHAHHNNPSSRILAGHDHRTNPLGITQQGNQPPFHLLTSLPVNFTADKVPSVPASWHGRLNWPFWRPATGPQPRHAPRSTINGRHYTRSMGMPLVVNSFGGK